MSDFSVLTKAYWLHSQPDKLAHGLSEVTAKTKGTSQCGSFFFFLVCFLKMRGIILSGS